jgi:hypothetical protein
MRRWIFSYDLAAVPEDGYVVTDDGSHMSGYPVGEGTTWIH